MIGRLVASLVMQNKQWGSGLNAAKSQFGGFTSFIGRNALSIGASIGAAFAIKDLVDSARDAAQAGKKLEGVLAATGHAAGLSAKEIKAFAKDLQNITNFEDDATVAAAAVMLTFRQIKGDVFKTAMERAMDLATVMEGDLQGAVVKVAKALNDPGKGARALRIFTADQMKMIASLQKSGDLLGAQKFILAELEHRYGGLSRVMADPLTQLENQLGEVKETLGAALLPTVNELAIGLKLALAPVTDAGDDFDKFGNSARNAIDPIGSLAQAVSGLSDTWQGSVIAVKMVEASYTGLRLALTKLLQVATLQARLANKMFPTEAVTDFFDVLDNAAEDVERELKKQGEEIRKAIDAPWTSDKVEAFFKKVKAEAAAAKAEVERLKAATAGKGGALDPNAGAADKAAKDEEKRMKALKTEAEGVFKSTRTPFEDFQSEFEKLQKLFGEKLIDDDTLSRALVEAIDKLKKEAGDKFQKEIAPQLTGMLNAAGLGTDILDTPKPVATRLSGALNINTAEGQQASWSHMMAAKFGAPSKDKAALETAKNTRDMAKNFQTLATVLKAQAGGDGADLVQVDF